MRHPSRLPESCPRPCKWKGTRRRLFTSLTTLIPGNISLVTGATGFIGAHVVDVLLSRGLRVRGATRSPSKGEAMIKARPLYANKLDFVRIDDFQITGVFADAVKGIDAVVHVASVRCLSTESFNQSKSSEHDQPRRANLTLNRSPSRITSRKMIRNSSSRP
jgi:UDP-glucose 4-epimerase